MNPTLLADRNAVAETFAALAVQAGAIVMRHYCAGVAVRVKPDASPVTQADEETEEFLLRGLGRHFPGVPVVAEEAASHGAVPRCGQAFILVDPLDGTKEFLRANGEFTVNLALIDAGVPVAGAVYAPAIGRLWYGGRQAYVCETPPGATFPSHAAVREIHARRPAPEGLIVLESRSHPEPRTEDFLRGLRVLERRKAGSSLKFCLLAEGAADVYPRFGPTMEWDTAAGDAVLRAAGGIVLGPDGQPLAYAKETSGFRNSDFIAWGFRPADTIR